MRIFAGASALKADVGVPSTRAAQSTNTRLFVMTESYLLNERRTLFALPSTMFGRLCARLKIVLDRQIEKRSVVVGFVIKPDRGCGADDNLQFFFIDNRRAKSRRDNRLELARSAAVIVEILLEVADPFEHQMESREERVDPASADVVRDQRMRRRLLTRPVVQHRAHVR